MAEGTDDSGLEQGGSCADGEKWSDPGYILKV